MWHSIMNNYNLNNNEALRLLLNKILKIHGELGLIDILAGKYLSILDSRVLNTAEIREMSQGVEQLLTLRDEVLKQLIVIQNISPYPLFPPLDSSILVGNSKHLSLVSKYLKGISFRNFGSDSSPGTNPVWSRNPNRLGKVIDPIIYISKETLFIWGRLLS